MIIINHPMTVFAVLDSFFLGGKGSIPASIASAMIANSSSIVSGPFIDIPHGSTVGSHPET